MNNTMVREIRGTKIIQNHLLKIRVRKKRGGGNYASKYGRIRRFNTSFTNARHPSASRARSIQYMPTHPTS